jgi:hypothetical protein
MFKKETPSPGCEVDVNPFVMGESVLEILEILDIVSIIIKINILNFYYNCEID